MPLTPRQRNFIKAWIENGGNGSKAYTAAYGSKNPQSASACASRLLDKAVIKDAIEGEFKEKGQEIRGVVRALSQSLNATVGGQPDHRTRPKAAQMALRQKCAFGTYHKCDLLPNS
jgi:phage terminase small subunit